MRVHLSGSEVNIVQTRTRGKTRRVTIGRHGVWTPERARCEAGRLLPSLKAGETPHRPGAHSPPANGPTVAELEVNGDRIEVIVDAWPGLTLPQIDATACYARAYSWRGGVRTATAWRFRVPVAFGEAVLDALPELR